MKAGLPVTIAVTAAAIAALLATQPLDWRGEPSRHAADIETVMLQPASFAYRIPGEFLKVNRPVDGPRALRRMRGTLEIMAYQVSAAEYGVCVDEGECKRADGLQGALDQPVTGVNFSDAVAYAAWLSQRTGENWRLPTDEEWAFAAAERFGDDALGLDEDTTANPATRWLAAYRNRSTPDGDGAVKPKGAFGANSNGLYDLAGNVWEWTSTCYARTHLDVTGKITTTTPNCGVRVVGGKHRSYMSHFLRDGKSGGCAAGVPPDNLGFRLVRERAPAFGVALARRIFGTAKG